MMTCQPSARLLLVGDINACLHSRGLRFLLEKAVPELRCGDIVYGNLEFPLSDNGPPDRSKQWTNFHRAMKPEDAEVLRDANFHVMSLANNHMMDFGAEGLLQTIELLDAAGIAHCGGGRNLAEARKTAIVERNGVRVAFLSYTSVFAASFPARKDRAGVATVRVQTGFVPHPRTFEQPGTPPVVLTTPEADELDAVRADIRQAKQEADVVVVCWHWGVSEGYQRVPYQTEAGRAAIDAGAAIVIGLHPHVLQGVETYRKGVIFYSAANFVFYWANRPADAQHDRNSLLIDCTVDKAGIREMALRPVHINSNLQPELVRGQNAGKMLAALVKDSQEFNTSFHDAGDRLIVNLLG
jgi:poly-gamma-glutamate capsule biosynthesis protein CapA/YwtB (metallophosphatase superfamily)